MDVSLAITFHCNTFQTSSKPQSTPSPMTLSPSKIDLNTRMPQNLPSASLNSTTTPRPAMTSDISEGQVESRILRGVLVDFGPGASVLSIKHPSDYSAILLSCNVPNRTAGDLAIYMFAFFREPVGLSCVHVTTGPDAGPVVAHVQVKDPGFAARIGRKFERYSKCLPRTKIDVRLAPVEIKYEASANPLCMTDIKRHLLRDHLARLRVEEDPAVPECAVCLTEAEDAYVTACGHRYCRACFAVQCVSARKEGIPIRCLGNSGKCSRTFLLPELKLALQSETFERLLEKSFAIYLQTIETIQECPAFSCNQTYRTSTDGSVITCFKCATPICTTCRAPSHSGTTCLMYQRVGTAEFRTWNLNPDIRKCPRCRNLIEKTGGCERVDCICGAGLCWKCMELWDENGQCRCLRAVWGAGKLKREDGSREESLLSLVLSGASSFKST